MALTRFVVAWLVVDLKVLYLALLIATLLATGTLAVFFRGRSWHEKTTAFIAISAIYGLVLVVSLNLLQNPAVFSIRTWFALP